MPTESKYAWWQPKYLHVGEAKSNKARFVFTSRAFAKDEKIFEDVPVGVASSEKHIKDMCVDLMFDLRIRNLVPMHGSKRRRTGISVTEIKDIIDKNAWCFWVDSPSGSCARPSLQSSASSSHTPSDGKKPSASRRSPSFNERVSVFFNFLFCFPPCFSSVSLLF